MHSHLERLLSLEQGTFLTEEEMAILKWGADYGHESRARHSGVEHRDASALEALVAYLYLFDGERLMEVLGALGMTFMDAGGLQVLSGSGRVEAVERALERFEGGGGREEENEEDKEEEVKEDSAKTMSALQLENETLKKEIEELKQKALIAQRAVRLKR
jgi:predicted RNase H-like nuclease (RuvC/YqgF family)